MTTRILYLAEIEKEILREILLHPEVDKLTEFETVQKELLQEVVFDKLLSDIDNFTHSLH